MSWTESVVTLLAGGTGLWALQRGHRAFAKWLQRKREENDPLTFLKGLPDEVKAVMVNYQIQGCHTLRLDPMHPSVQYLLRQGVLTHEGVGTIGGFGAVNAFMKIKPRVWSVMARWAGEDEAFLRLGAALASEQRVPGSGDA